MDRNETKAIVQEIKSVYQNKFVIDNPTEFVNAWHKRLKDYDFDTVMENLNEYTLIGNFPPSIADLVKKNVPVSKAVPDREETKAMMAKWEERERYVAENRESIDEVKKESLRKMRETLKIGEYSDDARTI